MSYIADKLLGPHMIIAGPGTGKTTFLISKITETLESITDKGDGIIVCTFTRKATDELRHRIYSKMSVKKLGSINFLIGTIHSICYELLVRYSQNGYSDYQIITDDNQVNFIYSKLKNLGFSTDKIKKNGWLLAEDLARVFNKITDDEIDISSLTFNDDEALEDYCKVYPTYLRLLKRNRLFDFATIQKTFIDELNSDSEFANEIKNNYKYFFIDEYQDVNNIQDKIFKSLSYPEFNITVVGDDDQSIYGFRGSKVDHIINFKTYFDNLNINCHKDILSVNYRSTNSIVNSTNHSISFSKVQRIEKNIKNNRITKCHNPVLLSFENDIYEAEYYSKVIIELRQRKIISSYNDICFLFRSLKNHSAAIKEKLSEYSIPFKLSGDGSLFDNPIGQEFMALIDLYLAKDIEKVEIFLNRIADIDIKHQIDLTSIYSKYNFIDNLEDTFSKNKYSSCLDLTYGIFKAVDFINRYDSIGQNIGTITSLVLSFDDFSDFFDPFGFYSYLSYLKASQKIDFIFNENLDAVNLMTIHQSKGLEFPFIFLPSLNERSSQSSIIDRFTNLVSSTPTSGKDEERRIFYVGLTRCEEQLILSFSKTLSKTKKTYSSSKYFNELKSSGYCAESIDYDLLVKQEFRKKSKSSIAHKIFSYNKLKLYSFCPLAYKFSSVWNLETVRVGGLEYGSNIHRVLEIILKSIKKGESIYEIDIKEIIENNWINSTFRKEEENDKFKSIALAQIEKLISVLRKDINSNNIYSIEDEFNVVVSDCLITGRFDVVLKIDDFLTILDFKTGDFRDYIDQLSFYSLCFDEKYNIKDFKTAIFYLKKGVLEYVNPEKNDKVKELIISTSNKIKNNEFPHQPGKHCGDCAYNSICGFAFNKLTI